MGESLGRRVVARYTTKYGCGSLRGLVLALYPASSTLLCLSLPLALSPLSKLSLQWQREGDLLGGDCKRRRRRLGLTSRRWRRGGEKKRRGEVQQYCTSGKDWLYLFYLSSRFVPVLHLLVLRQHCRTLPLRDLYTVYRLCSLVLHSTQLADGLHFM